MIDAMMDMIHSEQKVDVFEFVSRIRNQRPQMVQTDVSGTSSCSGLGIVEHSGAFPPLQRPIKKKNFFYCVFVIVLILFLQYQVLHPDVSCEFTLPLSCILSHFFTP